MSVTTSAKEILARTAAGPDGLPEAFWELVERYRGELVNQAYAILGSLPDAEDVVQESLCEAFNNRKRLVEARSLGALLRSINRANALDRRRSERRETDKSQRKQRHAPQRMATTGGFSMVELRDALAQAVEKLPAKERSVVVLKYWEHLSYEQIAARLNLPLTTVWRLYYQASQRLFAKLQAPMEAPAAPAPVPAAVLPERTEA